MTVEPSYGQRLFHELHIKQGAYFSACLVNAEKEIWASYFINPTQRATVNRFKRNSIFLILSQDCDIACHNDQLDNTVELVLCKKIRSRDVFAGNQFVTSVRKLQFTVDGDHYEANIDYILHVEKEKVFNLLSAQSEVCVSLLTPSAAMQIPVWRANRYNRTALPDSFNNQLGPVLNKHLPQIESSAEVVSKSGEKLLKNYIHAVYVLLDSYEEQESYNFEFFALLNTETPDAVFSNVQDAIEAMAEELGAVCGYLDKSDIYVDRASSTTVAYLSKFVKLNLDRVSLAHGSNDLGQPLA